VVSLIVGATLLLGPGCAANPHSHGGKFISEYNSGSSPDLGWTPYQATYVLQQWRPRPDDPPPQSWIPEQEVQELYTRGLARWKRIGFEKDDHGKLFAVAGDEKIALEDGRYCWHISSDTEYRGAMRVLNETGENVVYVAGLPFQAAAGIIAVPIVVGTFGLMLLCFPLFWFC
jgi:hypothetical protein